MKHASTRYRNKRLPVCQKSYTPWSEIRRLCRAMVPGRPKPMTNSHGTMNRRLVPATQCSHSSTRPSEATGRTRYHRAMFSYPPAFHAGTHADVLKHTVLIAALQHLTEKDAALAVCLSTSAWLPAWK